MIVPVHILDGLHSGRFHCSLLLVVSRQAKRGVSILGCFGLEPDSIWKTDYHKKSAECSGNQKR